MTSWQRLIACAVLSAIAASPVEAHGPPVPLAFWGGFPTDAARCQRVIARATSLCVSQVAAVRASCLSGAVRGGACDQDTLQNKVDAARARALDRVQATCAPSELQNLGYVDLADALADVISACRQLDVAAISAAFGPAMVAGTVHRVEDPTATCIEAGAREATRLLRYGTRTYTRVLDRIAGLNLDTAEKERLVAWAERRIAQTRARSRAVLTEACSEEDFGAAYDRSVDAYLDDIVGQAECMQQFVYVQDAVRCPTPRCGNGMQEPDEECDDGNDFDGDGCRADCVATDCDALPNTFDLIQQSVLGKYGCTVDACHGGAQSGGLDLRAGAAYDTLVDLPSTLDPNRKRIEPGDPGRSLLFLKLATKTLPDQYDSTELGTGSPMPTGPVPGLTQDELEAVRLWIYGGAPRTGTVKGVADLLKGCTPEPEPIRIKPLEPPPAGEGVQLHMPPWIVDAQSEHEVCFATYYDVTDQVPAAMRGPDNDTFCYNVEQLRQDPLSHHLIVSRYIGAFAPDHPGWGGFHCAGGPRAGEVCVPTEPGTCGAGGECATTPVIGVGCDAIGPPDPGRASVPFAGAQQTNATSRFPDGSFRCVPLKGMILWNSHAFNLTDRPGKLEAWLNFTFARPDERLYAAQGIFDTSSIFSMSVSACQQQEVCNHHVLPQNAHLFELTSHMHQRGVRWRTFRGRFRCEGEETPQGGPVACDPLNPTQCQAGHACTDRDGNDPMERLLYTNFVYNDPVQLRFDPPLVFAGERPDRTLTYCALYDNGFSDPATMKRQSTSPPTPWGSSTCGTPTTCYAGKVCEPCTGATAEERDRSCESSPAAGDGLCDGCTLTGGVTTEDEMFLLLGSFYRKNPQ